MMTTCYKCGNPAANRLFGVYCIHCDQLKTYQKANGINPNPGGTFIFSAILFIIVVALIIELLAWIWSIIVAIFTWIWFIITWPFIALSNGINSFVIAIASIFSPAGPDIQESPQIIQSTQIIKSENKEKLKDEKTNGINNSENNELIEAKKRGFETVEAMKYMEANGYRTKDEFILALKKSQEKSISKNTQPANSTTSSQPTVNDSKFTPSFDCDKASNGQEKLICADRDLAKLDVELSQAYSRKREITQDKDNLKKEQLNWIKFSVRACSDKTCLTETYRSRINELIK